MDCACYCWATDEKTKWRTEALWRIRLIVEKYKGVVQNIDFDKHQIDIDVPDEHELACAMEIERVMEGMS